MAPEAIRTLIVEDNPTDRLLLGTLLRSRGHEVWEAEDAAEALRLFEEHRPELVLLDYQLPGKDGPEICQEMRRFRWSDGIVILFITGLDGIDALNAALEAGGNDYLLKPITGDSTKIRLTIAERQVQRIREQDRARADLEKDALHDPLTGLGSHSLLMDRLTGAIRRADREEDYAFGVLDINLDQFAARTSALDRDSGDKLLIQVGQRVAESVRDTDLAVRISGDRFAAFLDGLNDSADPVRVAERIHQGLQEPFQVQDRTVNLSAGIGIAVSASGYSDAEEILGDAHRALLRAKATGPGSTRTFDPEIYARAAARLEMEGEIRRALDENRLRLWYQPVIDLATHEVVGVEALIRMWNASGEMISPGQFIPIAEQSGLIAEIGWWTMDVASRQLLEWRRNHEGLDRFTVAINVSAKQLSSPDFLPKLKTQLKSSGVTPGDIHLEITETAIMTDVEAATATLRELQDLEFNLYVDDFGTGYSSLSYLSKFPVATLKIDQSFVSTMLESSEDREVVRIIVELAKSLGLGIVAEGVETEEQASVLREMGCPHAQGYFFHRPLAEEKLLELFTVLGAAR